MIAEPLVHAQVVQGDCLPPEPTHAPRAHGIRLHSQFPTNLPIVLALCGKENHASSLGHLLGGPVPTPQRLQLCSLSLVYCQLDWFWATHLSVLLVSVGPILPHEDLSLRVLVPDHSKV